jgi:hypothetical protein
VTAVFRGRHVESYLDDLGDAASGSLQNRNDVFTTLLGLIGDASPDEVFGSIGGDLTRDEDGATSLDGLGLSPQC